MTRDTFATFYQQGYQQTVRFLISRGVRAENAREAAQAGWTTGWERREQLRNERFLKTWVNRIALNFHRRRVRREARYCELAEKASEPAIRRYVERLETSRILEGCTPPDRALFTAWMSGATLSDIAENLGVTSTAVRIRFLRARRAARSRAARDSGEI